MRRISRQDFETLVGTVALAAVALALWIASAGGKAAQESGSYLLTARFGQVDGLSIGNPVYVAGIQVGSVVKIELAPNSLKPVVTVSVRRGLAIPTDSALLVMSDGVLGGKYMRIEAGSETEAMKPGARFETVQDSIIVERILQKIVQGAEARRRGEEPKPDAPKKDEALKPAPGKAPDAPKKDEAPKPAPGKTPDAPEPPKQQ